MANEVSPRRFVKLRVSGLMSDGVTVEFGTLSDTDAGVAATCWRRLLSDKRWREIVFNALFDWMNSVLTEVDQRKEEA
ncbi:hypothetical protein [Bifidobacterium biavatii]|uniref:Uncharacterized protein n=1 Tax=Bifidobacterium biavatii DSM 23969 TaxID=1437608 RepID=A0A086ZYW5_9BIFI|nr:hypothetical protein [Bifidobacterium biavatii]KFI51715.1 hypothetical protein BBIA_0628 [Bifidobacterium biavatii DSM 23969]